MSGIVVPSYLHKIVVFPALSRPRIKIRTSFRPKSFENSDEKNIPILES